MPPVVKFLLPLCVVALTAVSAPAQLNTEFKVNKINVNFQDSPNFGVSSYDKRVTRPAKWLEVEVNFDWTPRLKDPQFADELTFNYYILLNNKSPEFPQGTLLSGTVTHVNIPQEKGMNSVVFVSPRTLQRFFGGKVPANAAQAVVDVGVEISAKGQVVANFVWKGKGEWWRSYQQTTGYVLNKSETPFAYLAWDYYEAIKPKGGGF